MEDNARRNNVVLKLLISAIVVVAAIAVLLAWQQPTEERAEAASTGPEIGMSVTSGTTSCPGGTPGSHVCVPVNGSLTLAIDAIGIPAAGYIGVQTFVVFGPDLTYNITGAPTDEVVWPDLFDDSCVRSTTDPPRHDARSASAPDFTESDHAGPLVELDVYCNSVTNNDTFVRLTAFPNGGVSASAFFLADDSTEEIGRVDDPLADKLEIDCVLAPPEMSLTAITGKPAWKVSRAVQEPTLP